MIRKLLRPRIIVQKSEDVEAKILAAKALINTYDYEKAGPIHQYEFKVFSQWGDDGIIQYLINYLDIHSDRFIEFGVENYKESNTRFLLMNNNWSGLVMDGSETYMNAVQRERISWRHDLTSQAVFITAENINDLITQNGFSGDIGILSIDIDGNDYWVWDAINCVNAEIVIVEYNSGFGPQRPITTPYQADFVRGNAHYSNLYYGVSIAAACRLADKKGYDFVGCNTAGNNAYFVRRDKMKGLKKLSPEEGYVQSRFKESRDEQGKLTYLPFEERQALMRGLPVYNVDTDKTEEF